MGKMHRKAHASDRSRRRVHLYHEALMPTYEGTMIIVEPTHAASIKRLQRLGWTPVPEEAVAPAPVVTVTETAVVPPPPEPAKRSTKELRAEARRLRIKGRSKMSPWQLAEAIDVASTGDP